MVDASLRTRIRTALIVVGSFVAVLVLAHFTAIGRWLLLGFALTAVALCAWEFAQMGQNKGSAGRIAFLGVSLAPSAVFLCLCFRQTGLFGSFIDVSLIKSALFLSWASGTFLASLLFTYAARESSEFAHSISGALFAGFVLIGLGGASLLALAMLPGAVGPVAWLVSVVAVNDIAAFFTGRKFQGPKLAPALSPNKTLSGSAGGLGAGVLTGLLLQALLGIEVSLASLAAFSALVVLAAQTGDLLKSFLKRDAGIKDSGTILPGHGGVLDRIDGELLSAPVFLAIVMLAGGF